MTAQPNADVDVESLRKVARRPLDTFLLVSIVCLFTGVAAVVAVQVTIVMQPRVVTVPDDGNSGQVAFKTEHFVYLDATSSFLGNLTMPWATVEYGEGTSKGNLFVFNNKQNSLQPKEAGMYFIYMKLNFTCSHKNNCNSGHLKVQVGDKLTCEVELGSTGTVSRNCWAVSYINQQKLLAQMTVPKDGLDNWRLELKGSGLGMFLIN